MEDKKEYNKKYYEKNKEYFKTYMSKIKHCEYCNVDCKMNYWSLHIKTKKHKNLVKLVNGDYDLSDYENKIENLLNKNEFFKKALNNFLNKKKDDNNNI